MPIYKFKCSACEYEFTVIRKMSDTDDVLCENCSSCLTNKMITKSSFALKGNGWYKDGYTNTSNTSGKEK